MKKNILLLFALVFYTGILNAQNYYWAKQLSSNDPFTTGIVVLDMVLDPSGNIFISGYFAGTVDFDHGTGVANLSSAGMDYDIFIAKYDNSGNYLWAHNIGSGLSDMCNTLATDAAGNVYMAGFYTMVTDFDPGPGVQNLSYTGAYDMFIAKYDGSGNYIWAKGMNGLGGEQPQSIGLDGNGNIYVVGNFQQTVDFDPGAGVQNLSVIGSPNLYNMFIAKYDNNGNYVWANKIETPTQSHIAVDNTGNIYLTGSYVGNIDFDPGLGTTILPIGTSSYIAKYNTSGNIIFAYGLSNGGGRGIVLDAAGNMYVKGFFDGTIDFDPGAATANLTAPFSGALFYAKYDAAGNYQWAKTLNVFDNGYIAYGRSIKVDNNADIILCGQLHNTADFDPAAAVANVVCTGGTCIYLAKYDNAGNYLSAFGIGNMMLDSKARSVAVSPSGNIFLCGDFGSTNDFDPGAGIDTLTSASTNGEDVFIAAYSQGPVNVDDFLFENDVITFFPNPVTNELTVNSKQLAIEEIKIIDVLGNVYVSLKVNDSKVKLDVTQLRDGIYFAQINNRYWIKFLKP